MPRPTRAHGRPGTDVIPADFEASHALVMRKTFTARCKVWAQPVAPTMNDDLSYTLPATTPIYDGPCRALSLNVADAQKVIGDDDIATAAVLVVLGREADGLRRGGLIQLTECTDPDLLAAGRRLTIRRVATGSVRWERDVYCTADISPEESA